MTSNKNGGNETTKKGKKRGKSKEEKEESDSGQGPSVTKRGRPPKEKFILSEEKTERLVDV